MPEINSLELRNQMLDRAPQYYTDLPYHNFYGHVLQTIEDYKIIHEWLEKQGIPLDLDQGIMALAYHDTNYHEDHITYGFETKEEFSASIAEADLKEFGAPKNIIHGITGAIIATTASKQPQNNLEKAVRLADVGNVSGDPKIFLLNTYRLLQESLRISPSTPESLEQFCERAQSFLNLYFKNSVQFEHDGKVIKYEPMTFIAQRNIQSLGSMTLGKLIPLIGDKVPNIEKTFPANWLKK